MKLDTQNTLKVALLMTVLVMLTACGAQKVDQGYDFSSRLPDGGGGGGNNNTANNYVLRCNEKSQNGITAKMKIFTDSAHQIRNDLMKVKITQIPASFASGDYLQFFRWQANTANQVYLDPTPVQARFETLDGKVLTNFSPVIQWSQVSSIASASGMSDPATFLKYVQLVVDIRDPQAQFDVLKIAFYNSSNTATVNMDMLMPSFFANPSDYAFEGGAARSTSLQALHPFASKINQSWTSEQFVSMGNSFCF